ncbi:hypothetical protein [Loigolactobacillus jiayinensis]|uniref:Condensation domain-containing protein n=1 Tax=Loigolactobacillus jiayinensis TaxID=2486016 RepID=A0ABW1RCU5_9LACO|nr:hypothetical protein [Loigolactobacillus jiayinensis]
MKTYAGEPLNILHTIGLKTMYPIVHCQIDFTQPLDSDRLKSAVQLVGQVVPQIFGHYELRQNAFVVAQTDPDSIVNSVAATAQPDALPLDFMRDTQLKLYLQPQASGQRLIIIMSHILSDGAGFKALLYLLVDCYNRGAVAIADQRNDQSTAPLKQLIAQRGPAEKVGDDHPRQPLFLPQLADQANVEYRVGSTRFSVAETARLIAYAKSQQVTLNDMFMATFGQIIQQYSGVPDLTLACPTDMRQFFPPSPALRIANFTARYNLALPNTRDLPLSQVVQKVHQQMQTLKVRRQFLDSVADLLKRAQTDSIVALQQVAEANYHVRPIAYTNFGVIDAKRVKFSGTAITNFIMTGSFRRAPMFQVAAGTFAAQLTLAFNMIGSQLEYQFGTMILRQMRQNLLALGDKN